MKTGRRYATKLRDGEVKRLYDDIKSGLGEVAGFVSGEYYYRRPNEITGLSGRTLSHILNHR